MKKLTTLILLALLLAGCASKPTEPMAPDFNITLPEGYSLSPLSDTECAIVREGETLGGLRLTDLGNNLKKVEDTLLYRYIDSLAPAPLIPEFMAMYWDQDDLCYIHVTLKITDPDTEPFRIIPIICSCAAAASMTCGWMTRAWMKMPRSPFSRLYILEIPFEKPAATAAGFVRIWDQRATPRS